MSPPTLVFGTQVKLSKFSIRTLPPRAVCNAVYCDTPPRADREVSLSQAAYPMSTITSSSLRR